MGGESRERKRRGGGRGFTWAGGWTCLGVSIGGGGGWEWKGSGTGLGEMVQRN